MSMYTDLKEKSSPEPQQKQLISIAIYSKSFSLLGIPSLEVVVRGLSIRSHNIFSNEMDEGIDVFILNCWLNRTSVSQSGFYLKVNLQLWLYDWFVWLNRNLDRKLPFPFVFATHSPALCTKCIPPATTIMRIIRETNLSIFHM